jgi:hypothetical protein
MERSRAMMERMLMRRRRGPRRLRRFINRERRTFASWNSYFSAFSILSLFSFTSVLSIGSSGSILSIGSTGSILSIGCAGSILSIGSAGALLRVGGRKPDSQDSTRSAQ